VTPTHRRVRLDLAYDGTDFAGWQKQPGQRTVQGLLEAELTRIGGGEPVHVRGAGRTDAGVHARCQVADCLVSARMTDDELAHALRSVLPADLRPLRLRRVPDSFHARRSARSKTYRYRLDLSLAGDPFVSRYALHHPRELDFERMRLALSLLPGKRDWSGFTGAACEIDDRVRTLEDAALERPDAGTVFFSFRADGFLTYMVRNLVGTMLEIGRGRMPLDRIDEILASRDRGLAGPTASARGLCLQNVTYPEKYA
jgi:tRNA pseudouridine38-40 synthase